MVFGKFGRVMLRWKVDQDGVEIPSKTSIDMFMLISKFDPSGKPSRGQHGPNLGPKRGQIHGGCKALQGSDVEDDQEGRNRE